MSQRKSASVSKGLRAAAHAPERVVAEGDGCAVVACYGDAVAARERMRKIHQLGKRGGVSGGNDYHIPVSFSLAASSCERIELNTKHDSCKAGVQP